MKAKLIKHIEPDFYFISNGDGSTFATTDDWYSKHLKCYKLSLKNCQTIERGYDLEQEMCKLVDKKAQQSNTIDLNAYGQGCLDAFQKALELMGDKKFSEEDLKKSWSEGYHRKVDEINGGTLNYFDDLIQSLQQTEWDVIIEMEDTFESNQGLGYNESVKCRVLRIDGDDVYGEYISGTHTNLNIPFSLSALNEIEGNSVGKPKLDADGCLILKGISK